MKRNKQLEEGSVGVIISIVTLSILVATFGAFSVWSYTNYIDQKNNVESKVDGMRAEIDLELSKKYEKDYENLKKEPNLQFVGPDDYGRLTFDYPKTWSASQYTDVSMGGGATYEAYLNPKLVPPVTPTNKFALRIKIEQKIYDQTLASFEKQIKKGEIKTSPYTDGVHTGTKLVGNISKDMISTAIVMKMRDRTLTLRTDGDSFMDDFEKLLKTVKFNE